MLSMTHLYGADHVTRAMAGVTEDQTVLPAIRVHPQME